MELAPNLVIHAPASHAAPLPATAGAPNAPKAPAARRAASPAAAGLRRMRRTGGPHRVDASCAAAGFTAPPCHVHLRFLAASADRRVLLLRSAPAGLTMAARWLEGYRPVRILKGAGLAPSLLRAEFRSLPDTWSRLLDAVGVQCLDLTPDGVATFFVDGNVAQITRFVEALGPDGAPQVRPTRDPEAHRPTPHQMQALANAVALGYYDIPRRVDLRTLAKCMGISLGSVSELLRRGEEAVVTGFMDNSATAVWGAPWGDPELLGEAGRAAPGTEPAANPHEAGPAFPPWSGHAAATRAPGLVHLVSHDVSDELPVDAF